VQLGNEDSEITISLQNEKDIENKNNTTNITTNKDNINNYNKKYQQFKEIFTNFHNEDIDYKKFNAILYNKENILLRNKFMHLPSISTQAHKKSNSIGIGIDKNNFNKTKVNNNSGVANTTLKSYFGNNDWDKTFNFNTTSNANNISNLHNMNNLNDYNNTDPNSNNEYNNYYKALKKKNEYGLKFIKSTSIHYEREQILKNNKFNKKEHEFGIKKLEMKRDELLKNFIPSKQYDLGILNKISGKKY